MTGKRERHFKGIPLPKDLQEAVEQYIPPLIAGQNSVTAQDMLDAFKEPDTDIPIPKETLDWLEEKFLKLEVVFGGRIKAPDGHTYWCVAVGWKRIEYEETI